jgi:cell wall-associated NlpC family hydrolase
MLAVAGLAVGPEAVAAVGSGSPPHTSAWAAAHASSRSGRSTHPAHARHRAHKPARHGYSLWPTSPAVGGKGEVALEFALAQIGKPYEYGRSGPDGYDCSGLAQRAWQVAGVRIPRTTQQQAGFGSPVPLSEIRPGDLVVFYADASHVGVYAGDGNVVVAPHQGRSVTIQPIKWMPVYDVRRPG